jgi:inosine-uridine nucleoside N-ribohydrolase
MKIVLDMDTGVDDALAAVLALNSPELDVVAVTTVAGNAPVPECTRNTQLLTELVGRRPCPLVAPGASAPLTKWLQTAPEVHGEDGLGGELGSLPVPEREISAIRAEWLLREITDLHEHTVALAATGPLTNVATVLASSPAALRNYRRIVIMGGAFDVPGNTGPVAEFNFYVDPDAAAILMSSGLDITLVPLDVTTRTVLTRAALMRHARTPRAPTARPGRDLAAILFRGLDYYMRYQSSESGLDGGYMHDPLAVASLILPDVLTTTPARVEVIADGDDRGRSIMHSTDDDATVQVAVDVDERAFQELLEHRVLAPVFGPTIEAR